MKKCILASGSPRRKELMEQIGIEFKVIPADCDETANADTVQDLVKELSKQKCLNVAERIKEGKTEENREEEFLVIGSDTVVSIDGKVLGKPHSEDEALNMLKMLSGKTHIVCTGVTVSNTKTDQTVSFVETTEVTMFENSDELLLDYIKSGEPMDKAGAYGIQGKGAALISHINGDYYTVVGLPIARLLRLLIKM